MGQCLAFNDKCNPGNCSGCCQGSTCAAGAASDACGKGGLPCVACASSQKCEKGSCGCSPASCSGCCDSLGACRSGTDPGACGAGGQACKSCGTGSACVGGACKSNAGCSPATCKGCCATSGQCEAGTAIGACGKGGYSCMKCGAGESCQNGVCNNPTSCGPTSCSGCCQGSKCLSGASATACGDKGAPCQQCASLAVCTAGACKLSSSTVWGIIVVKAELDSSKSWDWLFYTEPDPYVEITVGSKSGKTTGKSNTYTPQWDEYLFSATAGEIAASKLAVKVLDSDPVGSETIGSCLVEVPDDVLAYGYGVVSGCGSEGWVQKLELKFTQQ
jgi:hypothetical protein